MTNWIKVSDQLPPSSWDDYIILFVYGIVTCGWYSNDKFYITSCGSDNIRECNPKKWMPLPEAPKD